METLQDHREAVFAKRLETFLVEWKHLPVQDLRPDVRPLETFLVEWKHFGGADNDLPLRRLETFLVEWKPPTLAAICSPSFFP